MNIHRRVTATLISLGVRGARARRRRSPAGTAGRLDLDERDRAAVDGTGLVTAAWIAGRKVLPAYRATITPKVGRQTLKPINLNFRIRR
jgi:hypothetical protein